MPLSHDDDTPLIALGRPRKVDSVSFLDRPGAERLHAVFGCRKACHPVKSTGCRALSAPGIAVAYEGVAAATSGARLQVIDRFDTGGNEMSKLLKAGMFGALAVALVLGSMAGAQAAEITGKGQAGDPPGKFGPPAAGTMLMFPATPQVDRTTLR